ncbi:hypothetical protein [Sphingomonas sp. R86521]|uniref:hypothetical protein n=1 Tax=Sphingomonas sp. R86521 TaxID=3093860 RepID=UPI0036D2F6BC
MRPDSFAGGRIDLSQDDVDRSERRDEILRIILAIDFRLRLQLSGAVAEEHGKLLALHAATAQFGRDGVSQRLRTGSTCSLNARRMVPHARLRDFGMDASVRFSASVRQTSCIRASLVGAG